MKRVMGEVTENLRNNDNDEIRRVCTSCGQPAKSLVKSFTKSALTLETCTNCSSTVDHYIEYDFVVVLIDMLLMKSSSYRHILYNTDSRVYLPRIVILTLLATSYVDWVHQQRLRFLNSDENLVFYELEWGFYKLLARKLADLVLFGVCIMWCVLGSATQLYNRKIMKLLLEGIAISYGWNLIVIPSLIWDNYRMYSNLAKFAVLVSSVQVCKVIGSRSALISCIVIVGQLLLQNLLDKIA